jgi:hypothetical protein
MIAVRTGSVNTERFHLDLLAAMATGSFSVLENPHYFLGNVADT